MIENTPRLTVELSCRAGWRAACRGSSHLASCVTSGPVGLSELLGSTFLLPPGLERFTDFLSKQYLQERLVWDIPPIRK